MTDQPPITAIALFFDDIRWEVTGKTILIGQYVGDLVLPSAAVPPPDRLAVLLHMRWPRDYRPAAIAVRIDIPGSPPISRQLSLPASPDYAGRPLSPFAGTIMQGVVQVHFLP